MRPAALAAVWLASLAVAAAPASAAYRDYASDDLFLRTLRMSIETGSLKAAVEEVRSFFATRDRSFYMDDKVAELKDELYRRIDLLVASAEVALGRAENRLDRLTALCEEAARLNGIDKEYPKIRAFVEKISGLLRRYKENPAELRIGAIDERGVDGLPLKDSALELFGKRRYAEAYETLYRFVSRHDAASEPDLLELLRYFGYVVRIEELNEAVAKAEPAKRAARVVSAGPEAFSLYEFLERRRRIVDRLRVRYRIAYDFGKALDFAPAFIDALSGKGMFGEATGYLLAYLVSRWDALPADRRTSLLVKLRDGAAACGERNLAFNLSMRLADVETDGRLARAWRRFGLCLDFYGANHPDILRWLTGALLVAFAVAGYGLLIRRSKRFDMRWEVVKGLRKLAVDDAGAAEICFRRARGLFNPEREESEILDWHLFVANVGLGLIERGAGRRAEAVKSFAQAKAAIGGCHPVPDFFLMEEYEAERKRLEADSEGADTAAGGTADRGERLRELTRLVDEESKFFAAGLSAGTDAGLPRAVRRFMTRTGLRKRIDAFVAGIGGRE